jgi:hypothetical protein
MAEFGLALTPAREGLAYLAARPTRLSVFASRR